MVSGVSASNSGVRNLPYILGICIFTIFSGLLITKTGHYIPLMIAGTVLSTIGAGLIYTFDIGTPSSKWIGYQVLAGVGAGLIIQIPIIVSQALSTAEDMSSTTAIMIFFQSVGFAIFVSVAQSIFTNELASNVPKYVPGIDVAKVISTGATELRKVFPADQIQGIIEAYMVGLKDAYVTAIALGGTAFLVSIAILVFDYRRLNQDETSKAVGGG